MKEIAYPRAKGCTSARHILGQIFLSVIIHTIGVRYRDVGSRRLKKIRVVNHGRWIKNGPLTGNKWKRAAIREHAKSKIQKNEKRRKENEIKLTTQSFDIC